MNLFNPYSQMSTVSDQGLTVISASADPCVDIILIHGFCGHPQSTWASKTAFWPKDFLPDIVPEARILTYGYITEKSTEENEITHYSTNLLSVIENERMASKALIFSHGMNDGRTFLVKYTLGIIFLGTPYHSYDSSWTKFSNLFSQDSGLSDPNILETLSDQMTAFTPIMQRYGFSATHFRQIDPPKIFPKVSEGVSAILTSGGGTPTYTTNCKFPDGDDEQFLEIAKHIRCLIDKQEKQKGSGGRDMLEGHFMSSKQSAAIAIFEEAAAPSFPEHYKVPNQASSIFTGRSDVLEEIKEYFLAQRFRQSEQRRFLLYGMGGSGKTEIATKFAESNCERFWGIFWIDGTNKDTTEESFCQIARGIGLKANSDSVKKWLASQEEEWLLIFDNADEQIDTILGFFPPGKRGNILVTSRIPEARMPRRYEIKNMDRKEAKDLLIAATKDQGIPPAMAQELQEKADSITSMLDRIPLAIRLAAACIAKANTIDPYVNHYRVQGGVPGSPEYGRPSVYRAAEISFGFAHRASPGAANLLRVFAFFGPSHTEETFRQARYDLREHILSHIDDPDLKPVPKKRKLTAAGKQILKKVKHFLKGSKVQIPETNRDSPTITRQINMENIPMRLKQILHDYDDNCWDCSQFQDAVDTLLAFKLIGNVQQIYSVHPVIHSWIRDRTNEETQEFFREFANLSLANSIVWTKSTSGQAPHAKALEVRGKNITPSISRGVSTPNGLILIQDGGTDHQLDIILLHGLDGNERETWTAKTPGGQEVFWPQDLLPESFPHTRIFSYGYGAKTLDMKNLLGGGATSSESILEHGRGLLTTIDDARERESSINGGTNKPIIFICHSMGGLVVKQALMSTCLTFDARRNLAHSTAGIIFMGTPHRGSRSACWAAVVGKLLKTVTLKPNSALITALKPGGDILRQQEEYFPNILTRYNIRIESFYEALPVPWIGTVVPRQSACLAVGERFHAIHANHLTMCRFATANNKDFIAIIAALKRLAAHSRSRYTEEVTHHENVGGGYRDSINGYPQPKMKTLEGRPQYFDQFKQGSYHSNNMNRSTASYASRNETHDNAQWILQDGRYVKQGVSDVSAGYRY